MPEATALTLVTSVSRLLAPLLNSVYGAARGSIKSRLQSWKAGEDLEKISEYYVRLASVKTIFSRDEALAIDSFYYPSRVSFKERCKAVNGLSDLPDGCVVIEGVVGQGKSIFMRHLALSMLTNTDQQKIPIFVELRNITEKKPLISLIWKALQAIGVNPDSEVIRYLSKKKKLVLVLDGFDEVSENLVIETLGEISDLINLNSGLQIIVSSRPQNAIQNIAEFKVVTLEPLRSSDHDAFLKRLGVESTRRVELVAAIKESPVDIREAISTPLMMSIVVLVYESVNQIPPYLSEFFSALFHVVFTQHDSLKEAFRRKHHTGLPENKLQHLFEAFCFVVMQKSYGRTLSTPKFHECFEKAVKYVPDAKCSADKFRADIVGVACLMLEEGVGDTTFLHKGILDYFAAAFAARLEALSEGFYSSVASTYKNWRVTLQFLANIDRHRYLKFYYLVVVSDELEELSAVLNGLDDVEVEEYATGLFSEAKFQKVEDMAIFKLIPDFRNELAEAAASACREALVTFPVHTTAIDKFKDFALHGRNHISISGDEVTFGLDVAFELYGVEKVRAVLQCVEEEYFRKMDVATKQLQEYEDRDAEIDMSFDA
ncbi:NACHT domain-containing protein [Pseudomonas syringae]|uniref:NACHT domain-containing protein n=1 Tax=Pseudomonas syringae TaxID=317 RepID=UPI001BCC6786|nr:NACHT domain-containing protein [Pseudomonas syringae]MCF5650178.1 NACHT domain-containing protein [Pseudomonas syringae]QVI70321.1 NACHT domain-containing protein [Pseudomonas syringae]